MIKFNELKAMTRLPLGLLAQYFSQEGVPSIDRSIIIIERLLAAAAVAVILCATVTIKMGALIIRNGLSASRLDFQFFIWGTVEWLAADAAS